MWVKKSSRDAQIQYYITVSHQKIIIKQNTNLINLFNYLYSITV